MPGLMQLSHLIISLGSPSFSLQVSCCSKTGRDKLEIEQEIKMKKNERLSEAKLKVFFRFLTQHGTKE